MTQNWAVAYVVIGLIASLNIGVSIYAVYRTRRRMRESEDIEMTTYNSMWFPWRVPDDEESRGSSPVAGPSTRVEPGR